LVGLGGGSKQAAFDFKWADNIPESPDIMDFYTHGDVAPDARFSFRYTFAGRR